jgi:radical SAM superfamily enzyme with C-terminal helix-hairpin-helix motif
MLDDMMSRHRQEERAHFDTQLKQLKTSFKEDLRQLKSEMLEHVDQRLSDLEGVLCSMDDVDEHISRQLSSFEDLIEVKIEDHVTGIKIYCSLSHGTAMFQYHHKCSHHVRK